MVLLYPVPQRNPRYGFASIIGTFADERAHRGESPQGIFPLFGNILQENGEGKGLLFVFPCQHTVRLFCGLFHALDAVTVGCGIGFGGEQRITDGFDRLIGDIDHNQ